MIEPVRCHKLSEHTREQFYISYAQNSAVPNMTIALRTSVAPARFSLTLMSVFGVLALGLAAIGLYGVLAYLVSQGAAEFGIALGARPQDILRLVMGKGLMLICLGTVSRLFTAFALSRLLAGLLFNVSATDPLVFSAISALFALVSLLACYLPARRATQVDPLAALRRG